MIDLYEQIPALLNSDSSRDGLFSEWLRLLSDDCATRSEVLNSFLSPAVENHLIDEILKIETQLSKVLETAIELQSRALWLGLFKQVTDTGASLTVYAGFSQRISEDGSEWECDTAPVDDSYLLLPQLTAAYAEPAIATGDTKYAIRVLIPLAFLAALIFKLSGRREFFRIKEFAFGWDGGDSLNWVRPESESSRRR